MSRGALIILFCLALHVPVIALSEDSDQDGLLDKFEQELLVKFAPQFMVSTHECAGAPGEFQPESLEPRLVKKNSAIYGQVFRVTPAGKAGAYLEIHYYHLWDQDCGFNGHKLDAEHVSALITDRQLIQNAAGWKAAYWYAAAHEDTTCDNSHGVRASIINAEQSGPRIWISAGKHASYLTSQFCSSGCGGDRCDEMHELAPASFINLGERNAPMNGAIWIRSTQWTLNTKMQTDFPDEVLTSLDSSKKRGPIQINQSQAPVKAVAHAGVATMDAVAIADQKAGVGLTTGSEATSAALDKATHSAGRFIKRAFGGVWKALSGTNK